MRIWRDAVVLAIWATTGIVVAQTSDVSIRFDEPRGELLVADEYGGERALIRLPHLVDDICTVETDGLLQVFMTDGNGGVHHYATDLTSALHVRSLQWNPDTDVCAIGPNADFLYLFDETIGVWRVPLDTAQEPHRDAVALVPPWGDYDAESGSIDLSVMPSGSHESRPLPRVIPSLETDAVAMLGDVADDPAIFVNPLDVNRSLILGTDKAQGLRVYDLAGNELQFLPVGAVNNVDVALMSRDGTDHAYAVASNRSYRRLDVFVIDLVTRYVDLAGVVPLELDDPYGLCVRATDRLEVFVGEGDGEREGLVQHWSLDPFAHGFDPKVVDEWKFATQTEGCDVDTDTNVLYVGEEDAGLWRVPLTGASEPELILETGTEWLTADIEGVVIVKPASQPDYLLISSQGDSSFVAMDIASLEPSVKFRIGMNFAAQIDGVGDTDGLDVTTAALPGFPNGLIVVQDGFNHAPPEPQNFKLVDWAAVEALLP